MTFTEEVQALYGQYNNDILLIRNESTVEIFSHILRKPNNQIRNSSVREIKIGKFYLINYNFNGNKLWCPIITIPPIPTKNETGILEKQLKIVNNKNVLYAVNFDYLPILYKTFLIDTIINNNISRYEKNSDKISNGGNVKEEFNFKVNWIYNFLKANQKKNYAITAYDISKIEKVFEISSTILPRFIFVDTYYINNRLMYDTLSSIQSEELRSEFSYKIKMYEEILKMYYTDVENFYKALKGFEKSLKLIDNL
jgi:hypothetical protein